MDIKFRHLKKFFNMVCDTSYVNLAKDYNSKHDRPLSLFRLFFDTFFCKLRYGINSREYFYFSFYDKSAYSRRSFVGEAETVWTIAYKVNRGDKSLFHNKFKTYNAFCDYYRREVICVNLVDGVKQMRVFGQKHGSFILKPLSTNQGKGIEFWDKKMEDSELFFSAYENQTGMVVLEEIIQQDEEMAAFHPLSINTIRYAVYYTNEGVDRLFAIIRMGAGTSRVDNTHQGGICAAVDIDTGIIISPGIRHDGEHFLFHPDTGKQILGSKIPKWDELNKMIEDISPKNSPVHLVGWDLALSREGWCIVEGNCGPSMRGIQGSLNKGFRSVFKRIQAE